MKRLAFLCAAVCLFAVATMSAQDAVKVDPKHYKVEVDNPQVRVLRIHYGAHEKSVMHSHPASVVVFLTDGKIRFTLPDGKTEESTGKKGEARYMPAQVHNPENMADAPFEVIQVELKSPKTESAKSTAKSTKK